MANTPRTPPPAGHTVTAANADAMKRKRKQVLNEMYETEKTYHHNLMLLTTLFLEPVKVSAILPPKLIEGLFSNVEAIQNVSGHLISQMEEYGVLHALLELAPYLKLYSVYANNFNSAHKLLDELQERSEDFKRLLKFQEGREEMEGLKLNSLLLTPIQRVPRYRLLLETLLKQTPESDPNRTKLHIAYEEISKITSHINECVRQHENFSTMLSIQNNFQGPKVPQILQPGRNFIRQGVVNKMTAKKGGGKVKAKGKEWTLFLFNDMLLCAKKTSSEQYQCCRVYQLISCLIEEVRNEDTKDEEEDIEVFKLICGDESVLLSATKGGDKSWVKEIKCAITQLHGNLASLKRGGDIGSPTSAAAYEMVKMKSKTKLVTSPKRNGLWKWKSCDGVGASPLLKDISNLTPTKRNTVHGEQPTFNIFDLYDVTKDGDVNSSYLETFMNNSHNNNNNNNSTVLTINSSLLDHEDRQPPVCDCFHADRDSNSLNSSFGSEEGATPFINWTVTEKGGEGEKDIGLLNEKCCCVRKRKENNRNNITGPYVKRKKIEEFKTVLENSSSGTPTGKSKTPSPPLSVGVRSPDRSSSLNDSSSSCAIM